MLRKWTVLAALLAPLMIIGACGSAPAQQTPDITATTTETSTSTPATTAPPATSEPATSTPPSVLSGLNLPAEFLPEKRLDVEMVYSSGDGPGYCYLGSYAMLARFADSDIDFTEVIAGSGVAASAVYIAPVNLLMNGAGIGCIGTAAGNQGFAYYLAATEGAKLTDEFFAASLVSDARENIALEDEGEAFALLRKLLSAGIPVMVHLDISCIQEPLAAHSSYMGDIFRFSGAVHVDHYMVVTGYDGDFVYLNDPTEPSAGQGEDIPVPAGGFLEAWYNGGSLSLSEDCRMGPYWMLFLGERGDAAGAGELLTWNREIAAAAPAEIRKAAEDPNIIDVMHCDEMGRARREFGAFLQQNGCEEAGELFLEMAELFRGLCGSADPGADLRRIAGLQEQSLELW